MNLTISLQAQLLCQIVLTLKAHTLKGTASPLHDTRHATIWHKSFKEALAATKQEHPPVQTSLKSTS
jgi:hypothetical protein